jgi:hypothetical protein
VKRSVVDAALAMGHCDHVSPSELNALWERAYAAEARISELENLVEVHEMSARDRNRQLSESHTRIDELEREQRRLEGMLTHAGACELQNLEGWADAEAKLAAANTLLGELNRKATVPYTDSGNDLKRRVDDYLTNQPAAPIRTEDDCRCGHAGCPSCDAAPTLTEAPTDLGEAIIAAVNNTAIPASVLSRVYQAIRDWTGRDPKGFPARTESDQAVLDEMARMSDSTLCWYRGNWSGPWTGAANAELARRGLK